MARTAFIRVMLSTICVPEPLGTPPTTSPVLPPWGTIGVFAAAQALTTAATCAVSPGRTTARARPCTRLRQSCSQVLRSVAGSSWVSTLAGPQIWRNWAISAVWAWDKAVMSKGLQALAVRQEGRLQSRGTGTKLPVALAALKRMRTCKAQATNKVVHSKVWTPASAFAGQGSPHARTTPSMK